VTASPRPEVGALVVFHLRVGTRLAMKTMAPAIATSAGAMVVVADGFPTAFVRMLFADWGPGTLRPALVLLSLAFAAAARPRVCSGLDGWLRHLPASGRQQRRAAMLAIAVAQAPLVAGLAFLAWIAFHGWNALVADIAGLAVCAPAAALAVMPVEGGVRARPLALAAAGLAVTGGWVAVVSGAAVLLAADVSAGALLTMRRASIRTRRGARTPSALARRIAWQATRRGLWGAAVASLIPLAAATLFLANNTLTPEQARLAVRFGGGAAVVLLCAGLGDLLAVRRPAWPWSRSLPWSAARRVITDAGLLAAPALAMVILSARLDPRASLAVLATVPFVCVRSAGAMRRAPERRTGASGEIAVEGGLLVAAVAVQPWLALATLAAVPWAIRAAAERERAQKVSRWLEVHHLAVGDPLSWSA